MEDYKNKTDQSVYERFKNKIDNNPIFSLQGEKDSSDYRIYKNQLIEDIYCYLESMDYTCVMKGKPKYTDFADCIVITVNKCLEKYDGERGTSFWSYFSVCWKNEYNKNVRDTIISNNYMETKFTEAQKRLISSFETDYSKRQLKRDEKIKVFAKDKGISIEKAEDIYVIYLDKILSDVESDDDNDKNTKSTLDTVAAPNSDPANMKSQLDLQESLGGFLALIESKYQKMRVDKCMGSAVITNLIADYLLEYYYSLGSFKEIIVNYSTYNDAVFGEIIKANAQLEWETVADLCHKLPASVSRAKVNIRQTVFTEEVRQYLDGNRLGG